MTRQFSGSGNIYAGAERSRPSGAAKRAYDDPGAPGYASNGYDSRGYDPNTYDPNAYDPNAYDYDYPDDAGDDHDGEGGYYYDDSRWRWLGWVAIAVVIVAVVATAVILNGGDSGSTAGRVEPSLNRPATSPPPVPTESLPPETVVTVTPPAPSPTRAPSNLPTSRPSASAPPTASLPTPTAAAPVPPPQLDPGTLVYTISGTKHPGDIITVTYTDGTGALRTDFNIALPWQMTIVPGRNVLLNSVTAASFISKLNCTITDGAGRPLVSQNFNTIATTCNR